MPYTTCTRSEQAFGKRFGANIFGLSTMTQSKESVWVGPLFLQLAHIPTGSDMGVKAKAKPGLGQTRHACKGRNWNWTAAA